MNLKFAFTIIPFININPNKYLYSILGKNKYRFVRKRIIKYSYKDKENDIPKVIKLAKASSFLALTNNIYMLSDNLNENINYLDYKTNVKIENPSYYTDNYIPSGDIWSYSTLIHKIKEKVIEGISISSDGTKLIAIDNKYINHISSINLHVINGSPLYLERLVDLMIKYNIQFDFIQ